MDGISFVGQTQQHCNIKTESYPLSGEVCHTRSLPSFLIRIWR